MLIVALPACIIYMPDDNDARLVIADRRHVFGLAPPRAATAVAYPITVRTDNRQRAVAGNRSNSYFVFLPTIQALPSANYMFAVIIVTLTLPPAFARSETD